MKTFETQRQITRVTIDAEVTFEGFVERFQERLGKLDSAAYVSLAAQPAEMAAALVRMEGDQGLMIFYSLDHGHALEMVGESKKAIRFILGNPLVAIQMTRHDIRAAQYVPLTLIAYEADENRVRIEYDQPSSLLGVCNSADVDKVAFDLDRKLFQVVEHAIQDAIR